MATSYNLVQDSQMRKLHSRMAKLYTVEQRTSLSLHPNAMFENLEGEESSGGESSGDNYPLCCLDVFKIK